MKSFLFDPLQSTVFTSALRLAVVAALMTCATAARADCPSAPLASANDMIVSFLSSVGTQVAPAALYPSNVKEGMLVYDDATNALKLCDGTSWQSLQIVGATIVETDPQVGAVTNNQWCRGNGTSVECDQSAPSSTPAADSLDFTEFKDAMTLDASTDIAASGTNVLSITNAGTGLSLRVNDDGTTTDASAFVIDASGNVGIGTTTPAYPLTITTSTSGCAHRVMATTCSDP